MRISDWSSDVCSSDLDPRAKQESVSGELRVTRLIADGPRLHTIHLSLRGRRSSGDYGGSDEVDLGPTRIGVPVTAAKPDFVFGEVSTDKVHQLNYGISYEGRRSEEHTSELQSLMRISYAVF